MKDFKGFIYHNDLSQKEVMEYLEVSKGYMSLVISGKKKLSEENFRKLIENPYGWDVSMLVETETQSRDEMPGLVTEPKPQMSNVEILLRDMLAEKEAKIDALNELIWELKEENARLKTLLESERKGGIVQIADSSSVANA